jgi:serine phosphatase RsbU (regulator of sigma subunit)
VQRLLRSFDGIFELDHRVGDRALRELVVDMLRGIDANPLPDWGTPADRERLAEEAGPFVRFCYRPHLFPGMAEPLRLAHKLQFHLLPQELPPGAPVEVAAVLESYCHLSGDLFGWEVLRDGRFLMWILDVAGHGVRAGLCSAVVKLLVDRARGRSDVGALLGALNRSLYDCREPGHENLFATGFFLALDPDGGGVYGSAGHPPQLIRRRDGSLEELPSTSLPLGAFRDTAFPARTLRLEAGDALLLYTDGVIESSDEEGEPFGLGRLRTLFAEDFDAPEAMTARIYRVVGKRQDLTRLEDDITFFVARLP